MKNIICTICARSGSKGVQNKNVRLLAGKPLLAYSIESAKQSNTFDEIVVTSDSKDYLDIATEFGADTVVHRPIKFASDGISKLGAIEHAVKYTEKLRERKYDVIVDLDVTSPLRNVFDIIGAITLLKKRGVSSIISGCQSHRSPYTNLVELNDDGFVRICKPTIGEVSRRQDSPRCFDMNASIYVWQRDVFYNNPTVFYNDTLLYEMPFERSWDIDYEIDFEIVEFLMQRGNVDS